MRRRLLLALALLGLVAILVIGLSQAGPNEKPKSSAPSAEEADRSLRDSPPPLDALHSEANRVIAGTVADMKRRLATLRGYPVVVNKWASWCGPCKFEFPFLQEQAIEYGRRVAFIGLNTGDDTDAARRFLRRFPVTYPSLSDPDEKLADALGASKNFPSTLFLDRRGRLNYQHQGAYANEADFEDDIRRYALGS